jgi:hypothetical protein
MATYIRALNEMWADDGEPSDKRQKSGHQQIIDNANQVIKTAVPFGNIGAFEIVGNSHCMNSTQSLDGRGRPPEIHSCRQQQDQCETMAFDLHAQQRSDAS